MTKMGKKKNLIKDLHLDKPTSHGGWPDGHPGGYMDPNTPVYKQIADYLKAMGLADDDNPRARFSETRLRQIIRETIDEARSKLNVLHPMYSPDFLGDPEDVEKIDILDDEDTNYADEFYHTLGVEQGSLQNPYRVKDPAMLSGISGDNLDAYIYDAVNDVIKSTFEDQTSDPEGLEYIMDMYHQPQVMQGLIDEITEQAIEGSLADFPGHRELRKAHVLQHGQDPDHYARLTPENVMDEIEQFYEDARWG